MDGEQYYFTTQEQMLKDIANNQFIEYGQFDGNYYGTKYDTIRQCIRSGRMCILDISPQVSDRGVGFERLFGVCLFLWTNWDR